MDTNKSGLATLGQLLIAISQAATGLAIGGGLLYMVIKLNC